MKPNIRIAIGLTTLLGLLVLTGAGGAVELRFAPANQNIEVDQAGQLAVWLDEPLEIRTIELTVAFDGDLLAATGGGAGAAFHDLPCFVWEEYTPGDGQWYGFAVAMGADCFVVGPGELFTWSFTGDQEGVAVVECVSVALYDRYAGEVADVILPPTTVVVGEPPVAVGNLLGPSRPQILAAPNPCNPFTEIRFWLPTAQPASLALYDLGGRRVRTLLDGAASPDWNSVRWDGRTDRGLAAPSGVYVYRLVTPYEQLTGRVTLAR